MFSKLFKRKNKRSDEVTTVMNVVWYQANPNWPRDPTPPVVPLLVTHSTQYTNWAPSYYVKVLGSDDEPKKWESDYAYSYHQGETKLFETFHQALDYVRDCVQSEVDQIRNQLAYRESVLSLVKKL